MALFDKQINFIENFESRLHESLREGIQEYNFILKDYIIEKQLYDKGIDGNNKRLEGYKRTTIRYKLSRNKPADRTTLNDYGNFYLHITVDSFSDYFIVKSDVSYDKHIIKRYGQDVLKITNDNFKDFIEKFIIPKLKLK